MTFEQDPARKPSDAQGPIGPPHEGQPDGSQGGRTRRRLQRALKVAGFTILGLPLLLVLALGLIIWASEPQHHGEVALKPQSGLREAVSIRRDANGIPTVVAQSLPDAMFGLGFAHAQDRLWQMETHRRIGAGRLSEAFGPAALDNDRFLRALGVRQAAQAQWKRITPQSRELLVAYAAGVNEAIARTRVWPPEFLLLGLRPEPWDPVDSLAWTLMMAWDLGGNWTTELQRLRLAGSMDMDRIDQVLPPYPGDEHPETRDYVALYRELGLTGSSPQAQLNRLWHGWQQLLDQAPPSGIEGSGSNNWVLSGTRTTTGHPLLANDPHLGLTAPALWYFARIQAPGVDVAGATLPGVPLVVLGQNAHVAWGFTNTGPDVQDLYIEAVDPADPQRYRTPTGTAPFESREELIRVKGQADVKMTVRRTRHGPVISDAGTLQGLHLGPYVLALRWTALDDDVDSIAAGLGLVQARSAAEFMQAAQRWVAPMQNMVVADVQGQIGLIAAGRVPLRRADHDLHGLAPAPGWESRYDWVGWIPAHETPRALNPDSGWIATANHRIHDDDYPYHLGSDWALPYRQLRIEQVLQSRPRHSFEDMVRLQQDEVSLAARALLPWLQRARSDHPLAPQAQRLLAGFDGTMQADSAAPLVMWAWQRALVRGVFAPRIGSERFERSFAQRSFQDALEGVLQRQDPLWCDHPETDKAESCDDQTNKALTEALQELQDRFGPDIMRWRWGQAHQAVAEHRPFSKVPLLRDVFGLARPVGGDTHTVHATRVGLGGPAERRYASTHGPSLKAVYDLGDRQRSRFIHSSGQSGLPWKQAYRHWLEPWAQGSGVPVWSPDEASSAAQGTLVLRP